MLPVYNESVTENKQTNKQVTARALTFEVHATRSRSSGTVQPNPDLSTTSHYPLNSVTRGKKCPFFVPGKCREERKTALCDSAAVNP